MFRSINLFVLSVLFLALSCTPKSQTLSEKQKAEMQKQVLQVIKNFINAAEQANIKQLVGNLDDTYSIGYISNGQYFPTKTEVEKYDHEGYRNLKKQTINVNTERVVILNANFATAILLGDFKAVYKNGQIFQSPFAISILLSRIKKNWRIIHFNQSLPLPTPDATEQN
jgi:type II secretory pathway pseudopilin PulG